MIIQLQKNLPCFNKLFCGKEYDDDFGCWSEWNIEIEKWLAFVEQKDSNFYNKHKNRATKAKQRDELLGEYKAAYFIEKKQNGQILQFEPRGVNNNILDFFFKDVDGEEWFAEIKSPSWRNEVVSEIKSKNLLENDSVDLIKKRLKKPQYIGGEARFISLENAINDAVKKSLNQFVFGKNNILIITPNMFSETVAYPKTYNRIIRKIVNDLDKKKIISRICILEIMLPICTGMFEYRYNFINFFNGTQGLPN